MAYNGWSNYYTWDAKLWLDNDEESQEMVREIVAGEPNDDLAADALKEMFDDKAIDILAGEDAVNTMFGDILRHAMDQIDWNEIVTAIRDELDS